MSALTQGRSAAAIVGSIYRVRELGVVVALSVVIVFFALSVDEFLTSGNARGIALSIAIVMTVCIGQTMVIITRNIDLSVGSIVALSAYVCASVSAANHGLPITVIALIGVAVGVGAGLVNGALVAWARIPAIIATLGTLSVFRGLLHQISGGTYVYASELPPRVIGLGSSDVLGIPSVAVIAAITAFAGAFILRKTHQGRDFYAIGTNPEAARLTGIPVRRRILLALVLSGATAGLGGFMFVALYGSVSPVTAVGFEFDVITAAVIGGVNVFGGVGSVLGAVLGACLIGTVNTGFTLLGLEDSWQVAFKGLAIVAAVTIDALVMKGVTGRLRRRRHQEAVRRTTPVAPPTDSKAQGAAPP